ncbi:hypothetical protein AUR64_04630 [Haloprofundus marisrubri]|uniref:Uncharacterized protein n=2 Tax=Haloprofundus marisrubri TaxID=1514971 RepID=A0A0W1RD90_9EURY|nr:hypothetical protein AUR64_04630 [Haloprofundus marisrubri]
MVVFSVPTADDEVRLLREYVFPAMDRLDDSAELSADHRIRAFRYGADPDLPGGEIRMAIEGEFETVVDHERDRWNDLRESSFVDSWCVEAQETDAKSIAADRFAGDRPDVAAHAPFLATSAAKEWYETFDGPVPAVADDDAAVSAGWWMFVHLFANIQGADWDDEIDALLVGIENRLRSLEAYQGPDSARERLDDIRERVDSFETMLDASDSAV